jgi:hypothetical protein
MWREQDGEGGELLILLKQSNTSKAGYTFD